MGLFVLITLLFYASRDEICSCPYSCSCPLLSFVGDPYYEEYMLSSGDDGSADVSVGENQPAGFVTGVRRSADKVWRDDEAWKSLN